jgi:integrase
MSPYRIKGKGTLRVDRNFKGVGRLQKSTGVDDIKTYNDINAMLTQLYRTGKHEILREIIKGSVSLLEVFGYWNAGKLDALPSAATLQMVDATVIKFIETHYKTETTRRNYLASLNRFLAVVGNHTLQELPDRVKQYKLHCQDNDTAHSYNHLRKAIMAYLRQTLGKHSFLWASVSNIDKLKHRSAGKMALDVPTFYSLIRTLGEPYAGIAKTMAFTGLHWQEITSEWEIQSDRVWILGARKKKGEHRTREVPLLDANLVRPTCHVQTFRRALKKAMPTVSPYTFRHTYNVWLERAGILRSHALYYMGHVGRDTMDRHYGDRQITKFLVEDAKTLNAYLQRERAPTKLEKPDLGYDIIDL